MVEPNDEAEMNRSSFGQQNISPPNLPIREAVYSYAMFDQTREDRMQNPSTDRSSSNEPTSYSNTLSKIEVKNSLRALVMNCSHAVVTAMEKIPLPQPESLYQRVSMLGHRSPSESSGHPTRLNNGTYEYSIPNPELMYQFPGYPYIYVAFEDKIRPDPPYIDRWEHEVLPRLWTDIREFEKKMRRSGRNLRNRPGLTISPELRMSGHITTSNKVKLSPRIWILYGHERWRRSVLKFVDELEWLSIEGFGEVEVHLGGARLSALESPSVLPGLCFNEDYVHYLDDETKLYLHVEKTKGPSACGLVCCATVFRGGAMMSQRLSRIGGIFRVNNKLFGATTAHGMLDWFINAFLTKIVAGETFDDELLDSPPPSDDEDEGVPSDQDREESTKVERAIHMNRVL